MRRQIEWMVAKKERHFQRRRSRLEGLLGSLLAKPSKLRNIDVPPPRGVYGCGASTMARPGVKSWPFTMVKFTMMAIILDSSGRDSKTIEI